MSNYIVFYSNFFCSASMWLNWLLLLSWLLSSSFLIDTVELKVSPDLPMSPQTARHYDTIASNIKTSQIMRDLEISFNKHVVMYSSSVESSSRCSRKNIFRGPDLVPKCPVGWPTFSQRSIPPVRPLSTPLFSVVEWPADDDDGNLHELRLSEAEWRRKRTAASVKWASHLNLNHRVAKNASKGWAYYNTDHKCMWPSLFREQRVNTSISSFIYLFPEICLNAIYRQIFMYLWCISSSHVHIWDNYFVLWVNRSSIKVEDAQLFQCQIFTSYYSLSSFQHIIRSSERNPSNILSYCIYILFCRSISDFFMKNVL
jgi:hypothetical protein